MDTTTLFLLVALLIYVLHGPERTFDRFRRLLQTWRRGSEDDNK